MEIAAINSATSKAPVIKKGSQRRQNFSVTIATKTSKIPASDVVVHEGRAADIESAVILQCGSSGWRFQAFYWFVISTNRLSSRSRSRGQNRGASTRKPAIATTLLGGTNTKVNDMSHKPYECADSTTSKQQVAVTQKMVIYTKSVTHLASCCAHVACNCCSEVRLLRDMLVSAKMHCCSFCPICNVFASPETTRNASQQSSKEKHSSNISGSPAVPRERLS